MVYGGDGRCLLYSGPALTKLSAGISICIASQSCLVDVVQLHSLCIYSSEITGINLYVEMPRLSIGLAYMSVILNCELWRNYGRTVQPRFEYP